MARTKDMLQAQAMRRTGKSLGEISVAVKASKGTVSAWCRDIALSDVQIRKLLRNKELGLRTGQLKAAENKRHKRMMLEQRFMQEGALRFRTLSDKESFAMGLALYMAEGAKTGNRVLFVNSDPRLVLFMIRWLGQFFGVPKSGIAPSVLINEIHRPRIGRVLDFWTGYLGVPRAQFRATVFVKTKPRKRYANHERYYGTLRFTVLKGREIWYTIHGLMEGLLQHIPKPA